jgi:hypothetical protein
MLNEETCLWRLGNSSSHSPALKEICVFDIDFKVEGLLRLLLYFTVKSALCPDILDAEVTSNEAT